MNTTSAPSIDKPDELNLVYVVCEVLVAILAVIGNALVIFVFRKERRLRRRTNYYIISLAAADFLVGLLGIPFAIMASIGLPTNLYACLFTVSLLVVLCTISIFCLVAVSVDRYWAILYPMGYSRNVRTKTALVIISVCWVAGTLCGFLPLMGWHKDAPVHGKCYFLDVMDYNYLVFLYFGTIITPAVLLAGFYAHIYQVVLKQLRQIVTMHPENGKGSPGGSTMVRRLGVAQTNEVKATQNLAVIVLFFMICWIPLYTINCVIAFARDYKVNENFMYSCIILSHLNSAGNPLLYAYHLRDFRSAMKNFFCNLFQPEARYQPSLNRTHLASNNNHSQCRRYDDLNVSKRLTFDGKWQHNTNALDPIVKTSTSVAAATAGELSRDIWKVQDELSSNDSLKLSNYDKMIMIRPATPFRPKATGVNQAYLETSSFESDDVFNEDTLPYHDNVFEGCDFDSCLNDSLIRTVQAGGKARASSSPQISRGVFVVESQSAARSLSETGAFDKSFARLCPIARTMVSRSLSDEGHVSMDSVNDRKSNSSVLVRSSCGS